MTYPPSYPPPYYGPPQPPQPSNGMGTASMILGILALCFSFIPVVGVIAWPLLILGASLGGVALYRVNKGEADNKGVAITGIATSACAFVVCIAWIALLAASVPPPTP